MLSALRTTLSTQVRCASKYIIDKELGKQLEKFSESEEQKAILATLKKTTQVDASYSAAITGFSYKGKLTLPAYRSQVLGACGFAVTTTKQPKPALDLKKVGAIAAAVAAERGMDLATFKKEFGLVESEAQEVEVTEEVQEAEPVLEATEAVAEEFEVKEADEAEVEAEAEAEEGEDLPVPRALEEVEAPIVEDEVEMDVKAEVGEAEVEAEAEEVADEEPVVPVRDEMLFDTKPTEQSLRLGALLATTPPAPRYSPAYTIAAAQPEPATEAAKLPEPLPCLDLSPLLTTAPGSHIHTAATKYHQLHQLAAELQAKQALAYTRPTTLLHDVLSNFAFARLKDQGGASFDERRDLDELFDFGVYYGRAVDREKEGETMKLREGVVIPLLNTAKSKKSRFPPSSTYKELLKELSLIKKSQRAVDWNTFSRLNDGLKPLVQSFVSVLESQTTRKRQLMEMVAGQEPSETVTHKQPAEAVGQGVVVQTFQMDEQKEKLSRMLEMREVQLTLLIDAAQGKWYTGATKTEMQVLGTRVFELNKGTGVQRGQFEMRSGEVTWSAYEVNEEGDMRMVTYKMEGEWVPGRRADLDKIYWMKGSEIGQIWYRSVAEHSQVTRPRMPPKSAPTQTKEEKEEDQRGAEPQSDTSAAFSEYEALRTVAPPSSPRRNKGWAPPAPPS